MGNLENITELCRCIAARCDNGATVKEAIADEAAALLADLNQAGCQPDPNWLPEDGEDESDRPEWDLDEIEDCLEGDFDWWCEKKAGELASELEFGDYGNKYGVLYGDDDLIVWPDFGSYSLDKEATLASDRRKVPAYLTDAIRSLVDDCN